MHQGTHPGGEWMWLPKASDTAVFWALGVGGTLSPFASPPKVHGDGSSLCLQCCSIHLISTLILHLGNVFTITMRKRYRGPLF